MTSPEDNGLLFKTESWILDHPWVDGVASLIGLLITAVFVRPSTRDLTTYYAGLSALAGILMSSITFTISLTYGSNSSLLKKARQLYKSSFSGNWIGMTSQSLIASFLPLLALLIGKTSRLSLALGFSSMLLIAFESVRCIFWIHLVITFTDKAPEHNTDGYDNASMTKAMKKYGSK